MIYGRTPLFRQVMKLLLQSMPEQEGRRRFIKQVAMAGAGMLLPACATTSGGEKRTIAIVGGGIAGLTAAWRLVNKGHMVHLYEGSNRTGGRMFTKRQFNADGQFVELGGELVDTNHQHIIALAKELGVKMQKTSVVMRKDSISSGWRTACARIMTFPPLSNRWGRRLRRMPMVCSMQRAISRTRRVNSTAYLSPLISKIAVVASSRG